MSVLDLGVQRERRSQMLHAAESRRAMGRRSGWGARAFSRFTAVLAIAGQEKP